MARVGRPIRIEFPGAFYHAYSRGNQKQLIFLTDEDKCYFIKCLRQACRKYGAVTHTYCLMPNHFHLFIETTLAHLSRMMQYLITEYARYFNRKHERQGHLFQGRFRSVLVEVSNYAIELSRYIHLNPVRAGIVERPEQYSWSSFGYFMGKANPEPWLDTSTILKLFGDQRKAAQKAYSEFIAAGIGLPSCASIKDSVKIGILGSKEFIERTRNEQLADDVIMPDRERPQLRKLRKEPDLQRIKNLCERSLGTGNRWTMPITILIGHRCTAAKLKELGSLYSLSVSGASNAYRRALAAIGSNEALSRAVEQIEKELEGE